MTANRIFRFTGPLSNGTTYRMWVMPNAVVLDANGKTLLCTQNHLDADDLRSLSTATREAATPALTEEVETR